MEVIEVQSLRDYSVMEEEPSFSFQIDTSTFSTEDFNLFISSLEKTYSGRQLSPIVDQEDDDSEEDSLYDRIESNKESSISDYGGTSSEDLYSTSSSSLESLVRSDASSYPVVQEQSIISSRPSLMNIFTYFDQEITVMSGDDSFNDSIEEPIIKDFPKITAPIKRKVPSPKKAPIPRQSPAIKNPLRELDKNTLAEPQPVTPGRLNKNLLKIFESETQPPSNAKKALNPSKLQTLPQQQQPQHPIPLPRKAPIIRNKIDQLYESRKKVDNDTIVGHAGLKLQAANETPPVETTAARASSTVKIVNATRKVDSPCPILFSNPNSAKSVHHHPDRDKCFVRNINDLFLHYRTQQLESSRLDQHQVQQAIQQLDKSEASEPLKPMEDQPDPAKPTRKKTPEETAQQIHFRLQNQTYRVQMRTLIDTQNFVHMTAANRNQLFHLDKIFNRSSLSLIHMVLSLIRENVMMGDRVSVELQTTDYNRFVETMSEGSYGIDSMATSTIRENCVAVEILAVDDPAATTTSSSSGSKSIKIVILFVIETNDESTQKKQLDAGDDKAGKQHLDSDFQITVRMRFEVCDGDILD